MQIIEKKGLYGRVTYHIKDDNGVISKGYKSIEKIEPNLGFRLESNRGYQFMDSNGKITDEIFCYIDNHGLTYSCSNLICVQKKEGGLFQLMDKQGNTSEPFYGTNGSFYGFAIIQKEKDGPYYFMDEKFHCSQPFIKTYVNHFIQKEEDGPVYRLSEDGKLSGPYNWLGGSRTIKGKELYPIKNEDGTYSFMDENGNLSESFYDYGGTNSDGSFWVKKEKDGPTLMRVANGDILTIDQYKDLTNPNRKTMNNTNQQPSTPKLEDDGMDM